MRRMVHCMAMLGALASTSAIGDVVLSGVFPRQAAILAVDGGPPRAVRIGQTLGDVKVIAVEKDRAIIETDGKRRTLLIGQYTASANSSGREAATLAADANGHFYAQGQVNGSPMRFVVDTGATLVILPASEARRIGIEYRKGAPQMTQTANGPVASWPVKLDSIRVGDIQLQLVDAAVIETGMGVALLGMSFLNRVEMRREDQMMTLTRRF